MKQKLKFICICFLSTLLLINIPVYCNSISNNVSSNSASKEPSINSRAAIVIERSTHTILFGKNENIEKKMASTTKIMTSIVVLENANLNDTVKISKRSAGTGGSRLGLKTSDKITVKDLLYGLLLCSGNDSAVALAEHVGGSVEGFAELMNKKASDLRLTHSHFVTPHGLDKDDHYTTAYELSLMADYALKNETFKSIVSTKNYTVTINGNPKNIKNTNELLGNLNGVYGVKTGFTNGANRCLVTSVKRGKLDIICVVLGADTKNFRTQDSTKLIEYVFNNYQMINIKEIINKDFANWKENNISNFSITKSKTNNIQLSIIESPYEYIPINNQYIDKIQTEIDCNFVLSAPVIRNQSIGSLSLKINDELVLKLDILNTITIEKKTIKSYISYIFRNYTSIINFSNLLTL